MPYSTEQDNESNAELLGSLQGGKLRPLASRTPNWDPVAITGRIRPLPVAGATVGPVLPDQVSVARAAESRWFEQAGRCQSLELW